VTSSANRALAFAALHRPGDPLLLPNVWDVGSAVAIAGARATAATWTRKR
jgi:2-methylisocitrate lyase-like PEP mutase family enzyme